MNRYSASFLTAILTVASLSESALGQTWQQIGPRLGFGIQCGYFWNRGTGVVATGSGQFYYLRGGVWKAGQQLPHTSYVNSIRSFDGATLYAPVLRNKNTCQLWISSDSGVTWKQTSFSSTWNWVDGPDVWWDYKTQTPVLRGSTDVRLDSQDIVSTFDYWGTGPPNYTLDGGKTWQKGAYVTPPPTSYNVYCGFGACVDLTNKLYYACVESGFPGLFRSSDSGRTWTIITSIPQNLFMMDDVEGIYDHTYIQTSNGIYVTSDKGGTWTNLGGPARANSDEARFFVFGCTGQAVIAFDDGGGVWIANGWDAPDPGELHSTFSATTNVCDTALITIQMDRGFELGRLKISIDSDSAGVFQLVSPDTLESATQPNKIFVRFHARDLLSHRAQFTITPLDYGLCPITHPLFGQAHLTPPQIKVESPVVICNAGSSKLTISDMDCDSLRFISVSTSPEIMVLPFDSTIVGTDSIRLNILPAGKDTTIHSLIRITGSRLPTGISFDTTVPLIVRTSHVCSTLGWAGLSKLNYAQPTACNSIDTNIIIWNDGCDTVTFDLGTSPIISNGWNIDFNGGQQTLLPGQADTLYVHFFSNHSGSHAYHLTINYVFGTSRQDSVGFELNAQVPSSTSGILLSPARCDIGSRSFCSDTTLTLSLRSLGCDTLYISNVHLGRGEDFYLNPPLDTILLPNKDANLSVVFSPIHHGADYDTLRFRYSNSTGTISGDTAIAIVVNITRGYTTLIASASVIDFDTLAICDERDSVIVLQNVSCDTVCISSVSSSSEDFQLTGNWSPHCLGPGDIDTLHVLTHIDTLGHPAQNSAFITITSDADSTIAPIRLTREIRYPVSWTIEPSGADSTLAGKNVSYRIIQHGVLPSDVSAFDFSLFYFADLLEFKSTDRSTVQSLSSQRSADGFVYQVFHVTSPSRDSVIAVLTFRSYRAAHSSTVLRLSDVQLTSELDRPANCIADVVMDSSSYTLLQQCGDPELQLALNQEVIHFEIFPNPASDIITVQSTSLLPAEATAYFSIEDALGHTCSEGTFTLSSGPSLYAIDVRDLACGIYGLHVRIAGKQFENLFIKK